MDRTDRLYEMITLLRDGRLHRAADLARRLGVSLRTVYRDMETLMASGVPVEGARGEGYRMTAPVTLPPLNLGHDELEALNAGLAIVAEAAEDRGLADAARRLAAKIDAVLPEDGSAAPGAMRFATYPFDDAAAGFRFLSRLRAAIRARQKLRIRYEAQAGGVTERVIRPLALDYWGRVWTLTCWCELRGDFRVLRADRIEDVTVLPALFVDEPGKTLADYRAQTG